MVADRQLCYAPISAMDRRLNRYRVTDFTEMKENQKKKTYFLLKNGNITV